MRSSGNFGKTTSKTVQASYRRNDRSTNYNYDLKFTEFE